MVDKNFLAELAKLQGEYKEATPKERSVLPDGPYQFKITEQECGRSANERKQLVLSLQVASGTLKDKTTKIFYGLEGKENFDWVKTLFTTVGITAPSVVTDIPKAAEALKGMFVQGQVKTKDQYTNVYIQKAINPSQITPTERKF